VDQGGLDIVPRLQPPGPPRVTHKEVRPKQQRQTSDRSKRQSGETQTNGDRLSFTGEYRHSIDTKGRLIVPSRLRDELVEGRVVLTTWPDGCIALWSGDGWQEFEAKLLTQRAGSQNNRKVVRTFAASAFTDEVDRQGRISVPSHLREQAGIDKDVVVVGALDHAELWAPDRLDLGRAEMDELNELVEGMSF